MNVLSSSLLTCVAFLCGTQNNMFWRMLGTKQFWCPFTFFLRHFSKHVICLTEDGKIIQFWVNCSSKSPYNSIFLHLQWQSLSHRKCSLWPNLQKHLRELHIMTIFLQTLLDFVQNNNKNNYSIGNQPRCSIRKIWKSLLHDENDI